ncbi:TadE/TadG family type IV pilus assembly protein [Candidatus Liberibacter brunswickensis]|uniref:TadE/TadG family type IV pilus assembly protein n=1 Tax=Candidatus Liberibacter brunswickensis TaxID=1968796 RepID=UPI002FE11DA5
MRIKLLQGMRLSILKREGAVAIEFAILSMPYFMLVFAILEISLSFTAGQIFENATYEISRKIRTGEINQSNTKSLTEFRKVFCSHLKVLFNCSNKEILSPYDLYIDVIKIKSLNDISTNIPRKNINDYSSEIDDSKFDFNPGGPSTYNVLRAYYHWPLFTDFIRRYMSTVKHPGKSPDFLITSIVVFKNEPF